MIKVVRPRALLQWKYQRCWRCANVCTRHCVLAV